MNRKLTYYIWAIVVLAFLGYSCSNDNEEELFPAVTKTTVSLSTDVAPIIAQSCAVSGCHVAGAQSPNMVGNENILANANRINARAVIAQTMPPAARTDLTVAEIETLRIWIEEGAQNN